MRICLVTDRYAPEARAAAYHTSTLAEGWSRMGHDVTVLTRRPTGYLPTEGASRGESRVKVVRLAGVSGSFGFASRLLDQFVLAVRLAVSLLRMERPDAIYVLSPPLLFVLPVVLAGWVRGIPYVLNLHDLYPQAAIDLGVLNNRGAIAAARAVERLAYRRAARILAAAPSTCTILAAQHGIPARRLEVLWNFVDWADAADADGAAFRQRHGFNGEFLILYAGQMGLAQDLEVVLDCAANVAGRESWRFVLAGDGPKAVEWRARAGRLPNVTMLGLLDTRAYFGAVQACDVALAPLSRRFTAPAIPGKIQTIMACRRPVVAAVPAHNDCRALLAESGAGVAIDAGDAGALRDILSRLAASPTVRQTMGSRGEEYARLHFHAARAIGQTAAALELSLAEGAG